MSILLLLVAPQTADANKVALIVGNGTNDKLPTTVAVLDRLKAIGFEVVESLNADAFSLRWSTSTFLTAARDADFAFVYLPVTKFSYSIEILFYVLVISMRIKSNIK
jgi:hypothetical protein